MSLAAGTVLGGLGVGLNAVVAPVFKVAPQAEPPAWSKSSQTADVEAVALKAAIKAVGEHLDVLAANFCKIAAEPSVAPSFTAMISKFL